MVFKGIAQFGRWRAEGGVDGVASDGDKRRTQTDDQNCCRFHILNKSMIPVPYIILQKITKHRSKLLFGELWHNALGWEIYSSR